MIHQGDGSGVAVVVVVRLEMQPGGTRERRDQSADHGGQQGEELRVGAILTICQLRAEGRLVREWSERVDEVSLLILKRHFAVVSVRGDWETAGLLAVEMEYFRMK